MMKYVQLLLWLGLWCACAAPLAGKNLMECPFAPSDRSEAELANDKVTQERFGISPLPPKEIRKIAINAHNWKRLHPSIRSWINQNQDRYYERTKTYVLYNDAHNGFRIIIYPSRFGHEIYLNRTRWFDDDAAWDYIKEPAINPATKKPWIGLTRAEWKKIAASTKEKLSTDDKQFLQDVLDIVNENFHYYYGMPLVHLDQDPTVNKEELMGKFIPTKAFLFDYHVDMLDLSTCTEQQKTIYRALGHPIYSYKGLMDSEYEIYASSHCGGIGICNFLFKSGLKVSVVYFNQVSTDDMKLSLASKAAQLASMDDMFLPMLKRMERLFLEKGCDVQASTEQSTPLAQALALIYHKTHKMVDFILNHEYCLTRTSDGKCISNFFGQHEFTEGETRLSDMVKIPGVKTRTFIKKPHSSTKKKERRSRHKRSSR